MSRRDDFQKIMEDNLALLGARLATVKAKLSSQTRMEGKAAEQEKVDEWNARSDDAGARLATLKATRGDQWDVLKLEMARVWHDLDAILALAEQEVRSHDDAARVSASPPATAELPTD